MLKKQMRKIVKKRRRLVDVGKMGGEEFRKSTDVFKMLQRCYAKRDKRCQATK